MKKVQIGHNQIRNFGVNSNIKEPWVWGARAPADGVGQMRATELSMLGRAAALTFACALSACASGGAVAPSAEFLASQPAPGSQKNASVPVEAPTDVADLPDGSNEVSDPFEKMNRSVFERNQRSITRSFIRLPKPTQTTVPDPVRNSVENFAGNLTEPMVFANDVLQLRLGAAATTAGRFALNSTVGVGGLFDVATQRESPARRPATSVRRFTSGACATATISSCRSSARPMSAT